MTPGPLLVPPPPYSRHHLQLRTSVPLAKDKVRHVGEPLAMVVARSRHVAEDALADIVVDIDPLPGPSSISKARSAAGSSLVP